MEHFHINDTYEDDQKSFIQLESSSLNSMNLNY